MINPTGNIYPQPNHGRSSNIYTYTSRQSQSIYRPNAAEAPIYIIYPHAAPYIDPACGEYDYRCYYYNYTARCREPVHTPSGYHEKLQVIYWETHADEESLAAGEERQEHEHPRLDRSGPAPPRRRSRDHLLGRRRRGRPTASSHQLLASSLLMLSARAHMHTP